MSYAITQQQLDSLSPAARREVMEVIGVIETDMGFAEKGISPQSLRTPPRSVTRRPNFIEPPPNAPVKPRRMTAMMNAYLAYDKEN